MSVIATSVREPIISRYQKLVSDFNIRIGSQADPGFRDKLITEEVGETIDAIEKQNVFQVIDGLCDVLYVTYGAAHVFNVILETDRDEDGIPTGVLDWDVLNKGIKSLQDLTKTTGTSMRMGKILMIETELLYLAKQCWEMATDGVGIDLRPFFEEVHRTNMHKLNGPRRADGKQLKPEGWKPPRIEAMYHRLKAGNPPACIHMDKEIEVHMMPHPQGGHFCQDCGGLQVRWLG